MKNAKKTAHRHPGNRQITRRSIEEQIRYFSISWLSVKRGTFNEWNYENCGRISGKERGEKRGAINITRPCFDVRASG